MNRLRDDIGDGPISAQGIDMVRGTPPTPRHPDLKRKVWMSLQQASTTQSSGLGMPRTRMAVLVTIFVCVAGSASAVITRRWIAPPAARPAATPDRVVGSGTAATHRKVAVRKQAVPAPAETPEAVLAEVAAAPRHVTPKASAVRRAPVSTERPSAATAATPRERTQVLDAMVALRRDHDAVRAGALLDRYLLEHPQGALREEALVLAIEAANERGDRSTALTLARTYKSDFPHGRFNQYAGSQAP